MDNPLISVIIPIYNVEAYLERCLDSVINNTYKNLEIICVNDGSPDNCHVILDRYALQDDRIKVVSQDNRGLSAARNAGMEVATGDWLYFLDPDDWIHQDSFRLLLSAADISGADVVIGGFTSVADMARFSNTIEYHLPENLTAKNVDEAIDSPGYMRDSVWGSLYKKTVVDNCRFPVGITAYSEDAYFNTQIISSSEEISYSSVNLPLYAYYVRPGSIISTMDPDKQFRAIKYWIMHLSDFKCSKYAIRWIYLQLFFYNRTSQHCANKSVAKRNIHLAHMFCRPYVWSCVQLSKKQLSKILLARYTPTLYFKLLCRLDPTYIDSEKSSEHRYRDFILNPWDKI